MTFFEQHYQKLFDYLDERIKLDPNWGAPHKLMGKLCACRKAHDLIFLKEQMLSCIGSISERDQRTIRLVLEFSTILYSISAYQCFHNLIDLNIGNYLRDHNARYLEQAKHMFQIIQNMPENGEIVDLRNILQTTFDASYFALEDPCAQTIQSILNDMSCLDAEAADHLLATQIAKLLQNTNSDLLVLLSINELSIQQKQSEKISEFTNNIKAYIETVKNEWMGGWKNEAEKLVESLESNFWNGDVFLLKSFLIDFKNKKLSGYFFSSNRLKEILENMIEKLPSRRLLLASIGPIPVETQECVLSKILLFESENSSNRNVPAVLNRGYYDLGEIPEYKEILKREVDEIRRQQIFRNL